MNLEEEYRRIFDIPKEIPSKIIRFRIKIFLVLLVVLFIGMARFLYPELESFFNLMQKIVSAYA